MLDKIVLLYFLIATVTGQLHLQNNDQNALQQVQLQLPAEQTQQIAPGISLGLSRRSKAKPCHRRKSSENLNANSRSGWVPTFHSKSVYPVDQKVAREASQDQLTPQSLKESPVPVQEETSRTIPETAVPNNVLYQNEVLEANENNFDPDQVLKDAYLKAQEHSKSVPDQDKNQYPVGNVENYAEPRLSSDAENPIEASNDLCRRSGEAEDDAESVDEYSRSGSSRSLPVDVEKLALKLISRCVQNANSEESSRRSLPDGESSDLSNSPVVNVPAYGSSDGLSRQDDDDNLRRNNDFDASQSPKNVLLSSGPPVTSDNDEPPKPVKKGTRKLRNRKLNADAIEVQLQQPATGAGISNLADSKVMLMENARVCFACSSATDPSCWQPGPTTTIKYCKQGDNACVTKTFKTKSDLVMIRDCGNSCNENDIPGVSPSYKSCHICHSDQCNSADAISRLNMFIVTCVITAFKFAL